MTYDDEASPAGSADGSVVLSDPRSMARSERGPARSPVAEAARNIVAEAARNVVAEAALEGLQAERKTLPPSLFYDEEGCRLFYEITSLPEYYLTRADFRLLETTAPEVAAMVPAGTTLVEYGASDETKAGMLLRQTAQSGVHRDESIFSGYVPIDVAGPALRAMQARLALRRPGLSVSVPVTNWTSCGRSCCRNRPADRPSWGSFPARRSATWNLARRRRCCGGQGSHWARGRNSCLASTPAAIPQG